VASSEKEYLDCQQRMVISGLPNLEQKILRSATILPTEERQEVRKHCSNFEKPGRTENIDEGVTVFAARRVPLHNRFEQAGSRLRRKNGHATNLPKAYS
jgi:hypothetical protein